VRAPNNWLLVRVAKPQRLGVSTTSSTPKRGAYASKASFSKLFLYLIVNLKAKFHFLPCVCYNINKLEAEHQGLLGVESQVYY